MSKPYTKTFIDFRSIRKVLCEFDKELYFGLTEPPEDIIDPTIWENLTTFPDSAAIATSNQRGSTIRKMYELIPSNLVIFNDPKYPYLGLELLAANEDFQFSLFSILHGYYRQSFQALRSALEFSIKGVTLELLAKNGCKKEYNDTIKDIGFGAGCNKIHQIITVFPDMQEIANVCFRQKTSNDLGGWYWQLYHRLSQYPHPNREFINTQMWNGIGPVFNKSEFDNFRDCYVETVAACIVLIQLVVRNIKLVPPFTSLTEMNVIKSNSMAQFAINHLFLKISEKI